MQFESPSSAVYLNVAHAAAYATFGLLWLHAARLRRRSARALPAMLSDASRALGDSAPPLCVVLPVKGAHAQSAANWRAQCCSHGYAGPVSFLFVVQEEEDEAYSLVKQLQASGSLPTENVRVLVAGLAVGTSQKLHNLIHAVERIGEQSELVLMLDDDMLLAQGEGGAEKEGLRGSERVREGPRGSEAGCWCDRLTLPTLMSSAVFAHEPASQTRRVTAVAARA